MKRLKRISGKREEISHFLTKGIWTFDGSSVSKISQYFLKQLKVIIVTVVNFKNENIGREAVSLSFFTTMAFVPFVAVVFYLSTRLDLDSYLITLLYDNFTNPILIDTIIGFADNIINSAKEGIYGLISFGAFLWLIIWMMLNVERSFNSIWKVDKSRVLWKRIATIFTILLLSPFVIILFLSMFTTLSSELSSIGIDFSFFNMKKILQWSVFTLFAVILFTCMFIFIPNAKVKFMPALKAAILTGIIFAIIQFLYLETQLFVSRMNAVYGAFAAVPLFMVWVNIGWFTILIGSDISYALQNLDSYKKE